jgi:hypothetical protein
MTTIIQPEDFTFLGAARMIGGVEGGGDEGWAEGLAGRWIEGEWFLYSVYKGLPSNGNQPNIVRFQIGGLGTEWDDPKTDLPTTINRVGLGKFPGMRSQGTQGFTWNPYTERYWYTYVDSYASEEDTWKQYMMMTALEDGSDYHGTYKFDGGAIGWKNSKGFAMVPASRVADVPDGHDMISGFGGYESLVTNGATSMGLCVTSFNSTLMAGLPNTSETPATEAYRKNFIKHPYSPSGTSPHGARNTDYNTEIFAQQQPKDGIGFWTGEDRTVGGACVWIEAEGKRGLLTWTNQGQGSEVAEVAGPSTLVEGFTDRFLVPIKEPADPQFTIGAYYKFPNTSNANGQGAAKLNRISEDRLTLDMTVLNATNPSVDPTPLPAGTIEGSQWYSNSYLYSTRQPNVMHAYDPDVVLNSPPRPCPYEYEYVWPHYFVGKSGGRASAIKACLFDDVENKLYQLHSGGYIAVYKLREKEMADCDYTIYFEKRNITTAKANASQAACVATNNAEQAMNDSQAAYEAALAEEQTAKAEWEAAEQAENAEAARLGIDPIPPASRIMRR